jgi:hypothetical protein
MQKRYKNVIPLRKPVSAKKERKEGGRGRKHEKEGKEGRGKGRGKGESVIDKGTYRIS